jgi:hypothetical protein
MKSGTTALYTALIQHPRICACLVKEPEFFSENQSHGIRTGKNAMFPGPSFSYADLWRFRPGKHRYALEASTGYTKLPFEPNPPEKIKEYGLDPYFIYMVRDPFARIESQYNYMLPFAYFNPKESITDPICVALSCYARQLDPYRKLFGTERLLIIDFDDWINDQGSVLARVCRFLNLENFNVDSFLVNRLETRHTQIEVTINTSRILRALLPHGRFRMRLGRALSRFSKPAEKRRLTEKERAAIHDMLRDDMAEFGRVYGFPVGKWGF